MKDLVRVVNTSQVKSGRTENAMECHGETSGWLDSERYPSSTPVIQLLTIKEKKQNKTKLRCYRDHT